MCVVSMVMDSRGDDWARRFDQIKAAQAAGQTAPLYLFPTQQELEEFRRLLDRAREYDKRNNEPDCELESKKTILLELAKKLGVEIEIKAALVG